jgi:hypothetical protein
MVLDHLIHSRSEGSITRTGIIQELNSLFRRFNLDRLV